jgi:hypothetical protein
MHYIDLIKHFIRQTYAFMHSKKETIAPIMFVVEEIEMLRCDFFD